jgi:hypothetical protein
MHEGFRGRVGGRIHWPLLLACALAAPASGAGAPSLTDELVATAGLTRAEIQGMGEAPLARELGVADPSRDAALAGIIRLRSDGAALADAIASPDPAPLPKGTHGRGRFQDPPGPADVAGIEFSADELEVLADCKVRACLLARLEYLRSLLDGPR